MGDGVDWSEATKVDGNGDVEGRDHGGVGRGGQAPIRVVAHGHSLDLSRSSSSVTFSLTSRYSATFRNVLFVVVITATGAFVVAAVSIAIIVTIYVIISIFMLVFIVVDVVTVPTGEIGFASINKVVGSANDGR